MIIDILSKNGDILAINKPAGLIVQSDQGPPKGYTLPILDALVQRRFPNGGNIGHRIDRFTSGLLLIGTTGHAVTYLRRRWHTVTRQKCYLAMLQDPQWDTITVSEPIDNQPASTAFTVLERSNSLALVQCELLVSGRTHQIRKHALHINCPVIGDRKYGNDSRIGRKGQFLHAWKIGLRFPDSSYEPSDEWTTIQAPIAPDFRQFHGFNWSHWNTGANARIETWIVPNN